MYDEMAASGLEPNTTTYNALISGVPPSPPSMTCAVVAALLLLRCYNCSAPAYSVPYCR